MSIPDERRSELVRLASAPHLRRNQFTPVRPTKWQPDKVPGPSGSIADYYTSDQAWELIIDHLKMGHAVREIVLRKPPGKTAYEMLIRVNPQSPEIYVKVEIHRGFIVGRSFHLSE